MLFFSTADFSGTPKLFSSISGNPAALGGQHMNSKEDTHWGVPLILAVLVLTLIAVITVKARRFRGGGSDIDLDLGDGDGGGGWRTQMAAARQRQQLEYWSVGNRRAREQASLRREKLLSEMV